MGKKARSAIKAIALDRLDDHGILGLVDASRNGIEYRTFDRLVKDLSFSFEDWSNFLNISFRTLQRYRSEKKKFQQPQAERILQIALLNSRGIEIFGEENKFHTWLVSENLALGKIKPKALLDSAFGIDLLMDELTRIEHGILA